MTPNPQLSGPPPKYAMPIVALIISIIGLCFFPIGIIGFILGLVAVLKISKQPQLPGKALAIVAMVLPAIAVPITGIMAAIAIPNFIKFQSRSKQSECKTYLKAMYTAEKTYFAEHDTFSTDAQTVFFMPEPNHRYSYFLGEDAALLADHPTVKDAAEHQSQLARAGVMVGVEGQCPDCTFTGACVGNIDGDDTYDVWTISTGDPGGQPVNVVNDTTE